jgi:hypothetical protein
MSKMRRKAIKVYYDSSAVFMFGLFKQAPRINKVSREWNACRALHPSREILVCNFALITHRRKLLWTSFGSFLIGKIKSGKKHARHDSIYVDDGNNDAQHGRQVKSSFQLFFFIGNWKIDVGGWGVETGIKKFIELKPALSFPSARAQFFLFYRLSNDFQVQWMKINNWKTQRSHKKSVAMLGAQHSENRQCLDFLHLFTRRRQTPARVLPPRLPSAYFPF